MLAIAFLLLYVSAGARALLLVRCLIITLASAWCTDVSIFQFIAVGAETYSKGGSYQFFPPALAATEVSVGTVISFVFEGA